MEALMTNLIRLSRQRLKQFMPDKFQDPDDVKPADQLGGGSSDERRKLSLSEIDFDPSYLLSLLLQQLKIPFIRVRLAIHGEYYTQLFRLFSVSPLNILEFF